MPDPKSSPSKPKTDLTHDTFTAELTSGQLAFGVCILILFGMACFMLGVLIGRYQPSERQQVASIGSGRDDAGPTAAQSQAQTPPDHGETAPEKQRSVVEVPPPPPRGARVQTPEEPDAQRRTSPSKPLPEAPKKDKPAPPPVTVSLAKPVKKAPATDTPAGKPVETPAEVASAPGATPPSKPARRKPQAKAPIPPAVRSGPAGSSFTVQIGVFSERKNAEGAKRTVESRTAYKAELLPAAGGQKTLVAVGRFPDRSSALRARDELRAKHGYKDCFIKRTEGAPSTKGVSETEGGSQSPTTAPGGRRPDRVITLKRPEV